MHLKLLKMLLIVWAIFGLSGMASCRRVKIQNGDIYADAGQYGAIAREILTDNNKRRISKADWDKIRVGKLCTSSDLILNWRATIHKFCAETNRCDYEYMKELEDVAKRITSLRKETNRLMSLSPEYSYSQSETDLQSESEHIEEY